MTAVKYWDPGTASWKTVSNAQGPAGPAGPVGPNSLVAVQRKWGQNENYTNSGLAGLQDIIDGGGGFMTLAYTPTINVWWDVHASMGLMQKQDAAYHYNVLGLQMTPGDADGMTTAVHYITQHSTVQQFEGYRLTRVFKLNAGVAYSIKMYMSPSGGTWRYYTGASHLYMDGKAFSR